jgi:hypothetical protein
MARIGVTGHRHYRHSDANAAALAAVLDRIAPEGSAPVVISSLAEGADREVASAILARPGATLEVVLPLPADEFAADFASDASRREFGSLIARAASVDIIDVVDVVDVVDHPAGRDDREAAYERAGHEVVRRCDVLVAIWDGAPSRGRGGTADVIQHALDHDVLVEVVLVDRDP